MSVHYTDQPRGLPSATLLSQAVWYWVKSFVVKNLPQLANNDPEFRNGVSCNNPTPPRPVSVYQITRSLVHCLRKFDSRQHLFEDHLPWKTTFNQGKGVLQQLSKGQLSKETFVKGNFCPWRFLSK